MNIIEMAQQIERLTKLKRPLDEAIEKIDLLVEMRWRSIVAGQGDFFVGWSVEGEWIKVCFDRARYGIETDRLPLVCFVSDIWEDIQNAWRQEIERRKELASAEKEKEELTKLKHLKEKYERNDSCRAKTQLES